MKTLLASALALGALTTAALAEPAQLLTPQGKPSATAETAPVALTAIQMDRVVAGQFTPGEPPVTGGPTFNERIQDLRERLEERHERLEERHERLEERHERLEERREGLLDRIELIRGRFQ